MTPTPTQADLDAALKLCYAYSPRKPGMAAAIAELVAAARKAPPGHIIDDNGVVKRVEGKLPETRDGVVWTDRSKPVYVWGHPKPFYLDQDWNVPIAFFNEDTREWQDMPISECYSAPDAPLAAKGTDAH